MAYNRAQASKLLNAREMEVFESSRAGTLPGLSAPRLRSLIRRTRALRDKFRDLFRRQRRATRDRTRSEAGRSGAANRRTEQKAQVFSEVLQRFETRLARMDAAEARAGRKKAPAGSRALLEKKRRAVEARAAASTQPQVSPKAPAQKPPPRPGALGPTSESARAARHAMQFKAAGIRAIQGHVSSLGRRNQAKRDGRG